MARKKRQPGTFGAVETLPAAATARATVDQTAAATPRPRCS